jgi:hypothetical protein
MIAARSWCFGSNDLLKGGRLMPVLTAALLFGLAALAVCLALLSLIRQDGGVVGTMIDICAWTQIAEAALAVVIAAVLLALRWLTPAWGTYVGLGAVAGILVFCADGGLKALWLNDWAAAAYYPPRAACRFTIVLWDAALGRI